MWTISIGVLEGQAAQEDGIDEGEDRAVDADAEASARTATRVNQGSFTSIRTAYFRCIACHTKYLRHACSAMTGDNCRR